MAVISLVGIGGGIKVGISVAAGNKAGVLVGRAVGVGVDIKVGLVMVRVGDDVNVLVADTVGVEGNSMC